MRRQLIIGMDQLAKLACAWLGAALLLAGDLEAQSAEDTPEQPALGPQRLMPDQNFVGRYDETLYQNYGFAEYPRLPPFTNTLRPYYSDLGDFLIYGSNSVNWRERRGLGAQRGFSSIGERGGHGQAGVAFERLFNNVIVGTDGTDAWQAKVIWANEIRTKFTPLTFKMANLDGLRFDVGTGRDSFSALISRNRHTGGGGVIPGALIGGAHYERQVGFLHFGGTFVNAHQFEPLMPSNDLSFKGVAGAAQNAPALLAIRIADDAPGLGETGAVLHRVDVYVNGELQPELEPFIVRLDTRGAERQPYAQDLLRSGERKPLPRTGNDYQSINRGAIASTYDPYINYAAFDADVYYRGYEFPFWIGHLYYRDFKLFGPDYAINADREDEDPITVHQEFAHEAAERSAENPDGQFLGLHTRADLPQAFDGEEYGILYVDLEPFGEWIESVDVDLFLSGDYRVELSEIDIGGIQPNAPESNYRDKYRYASFFRTVARADGTPSPQEPTKRVRVRAGTPTGVRLYSANVYGVLKGFEINAEFARSNSYSQYVSGPPGVRVPGDALSINAFDRGARPGQRGTISDNAFYATVKRDFPRWGFGGEYFSMGPHYNTELRSFIGRDEGCCTGSLITQNDALIHRLVEDNDDNDRFPDSWYTNHASPGMFFLGQSDIDGIFPGLDEDNDGYPDQNKNINGTPDDVEPFLMYDVDAQVYDYDLDMNHNDFLDARENDTDPDYPYDPDLRGLHAYGQFNPAPGLTWSVGLMDAQQNAGGAPSDVLYTRLTYWRKVPAVGQFFAVASLEEVEDGVEDPLSVYSDRVLTTAELFELDFPGFQRNIQLAPFVEEERDDPLLFKDSRYLRFFTDARWSAIPRLNMRNKVKYEINTQHEGELFDGTFQESDRLSRWAMVHKIDYTWPLADQLTLFAGCKFRYLKEWRRSLESPTLHERNLIPLTKLEYRLTSRTRFQLGVQGLGSLLPYRVNDLADARRDFEQSDIVFMVTNDSKYFGYLISTNMGLRRRVKEFDDLDVAGEANVEFIAAYINVILGFEYE